MPHIDVIDIESLAAEHGVPGGAVGLLVRDDVSESAFGVLNTGTGVAATTDSLFQIGSITKLWTATLIMKLAEERVLDLDAPVATYLLDFTVGGDHEVAASITIHQLLTHTSGTCDDYTRTTRGDDAVARYVTDVVPTLALEFQPGDGFRYSNPGYVVLGRVAEVLSDKPYRDVLRERIAAPLGLQYWAPTPEDALLFRTAVGHVPTGPGGSLQPAPMWSLAAAHAPAGSELSMSAASVLAFAGAFIRGGHPIVAEKTVMRMWTPERDIPELGSAGGRLGIGGVIQQAGGET